MCRGHERCSCELVDRWCPECGWTDTGELPDDCSECGQPMQRDPFTQERYINGDGAYPHARLECGGTCIDHRDLE